MQFNKYSYDEHVTNNLATATNNGGLTFRNERVDDPEGYIENVVGLASVNDFSESKTSFVFRMGLKEEAKDWIGSVPMETTLSGLIEKFRLRFVGRTTCLTYIKKMANNVYVDGSIMHYLDVMKGWARRAMVPDEVLVALVLNGLPESLANNLLLNSRVKLNWDFVYSSCEGVDIKCKVKEKFVGDERVMKVSETEVYTRKYKCYQCGKVGHFARDCRVKKNSGKNKNFEVVRNVDNDSKVKKEDSEINSEFIYSISSFKKYLPCFFLHINTKERKFLLDTGSTVNLIHEKCVDRKKIVKNTVLLRTADGKRMKTLGSIKMEVVINNRTFLLDFVVVPTMSIDCIIGTPFVIAEKVALNWSDGWKLKFGNLETDLNCLGVHHIKTTTDTPICSPLYRIGNKFEERASQIIKEYLKEGIIRKSTSPWRSPVVIVKKKDGDIRLCIDYRQLNAVTVKDSYPMPRADEFFEQLSEAKIFTKLDAKSGYHQIVMNEADIEKTAFGTREGLFEFVRMPFGLVNGPATFQRVMNKVLSAYLRKFVVVYMDDILIYSKSRELHEEHVKMVMNTLKKVGLMLNKKKCKFFQEKIEILGHVIEGGCIKIDEKRVESISKFQIPKTRKQLESFLGMINYCSRFVRDLSQFTASLYQTLRDARKAKKENIVDLLSDSNKEDFETIKVKLSNSKALHIPKTSGNFKLITDASGVGSGAILLQRQDEDERLISFYSSMHTDAEKRYSATEQELLAVIKAIKHFRPYLIQNKFKLVTDHKALLYLFKTRNINAKVARWSLLLQEFDFEIEYIKGKENVSDYLSRVYENACIMKYQERIIPDNIEKVLKYYHNLLGHGSKSNMKYNILRKYKWAGANACINRYCATCIICQRMSSQREKGKCIAINSNGPFKTWEADLIGPLETSRRGANYILTIIDHHTKVAEAVAIRNKDMNCIMDIIENRLIRKYGRIETILTDNGKEFKNYKSEFLSKKYKIKWKFGSPYTPTTTGLVERFNQTLMNKIRKLTNFGQYDWEEFLEKSLNAYMISYHRAIGCSPYEMLFGEFITAFDKDNGIQRCAKEKEYFIAKAKVYSERYKKTFTGNNKKCLDYKIGDRVLYHDPTSRQHKLKPVWTHIGKILEVKFNSARIRLQDGRVVFANERRFKKIEGDSVGIKSTDQ
ncbi:MAG: reverse transcriptase domain-containing protein [Aeromonas sp.]